jgi:tetratricopeptide (TPR) repeat protein
MRVETALGQFYHVVSAYQRFNSDQVTAQKFCQSGLALAISIESSKRESMALCELAWIKAEAGDFSGAQRSACESQRAARIGGNLFEEAAALNAESACWFSLGSYSHCVSLLDRATHLLHLCGVSGAEAHSSLRFSKAEVHRCKSEYEEARNIQNQILHYTCANQYPYFHALACSNIAQIELEIGGFEDDVKQNISTAALLFSRANFSAGITWCDMINAALDVQQGKLSAARSCFQRYLRQTWGKETVCVTYCLEKLSAVEQWSPTDRILSLWPVIFLANSIKFKGRLQLHKALQFLGDVFWAQGDQDTASSLFTVALDGFIHMDVHRSRAECMVRLGDIAKLNGDELKAMDLWETARPLFERSSQRKQVDTLEAKLGKLSHNQSQTQQANMNCLSNINAPTELLKQLSIMRGPKSMGMEEEHVGVTP